MMMMKAVMSFNKIVRLRIKMNRKIISKMMINRPRNNLQRKRKRNKRIKTKRITNKMKTQMKTKICHQKFKENSNSKIKMESM